MARVLVKVTQDHIDRGEPESCISCPVALAARDVGIRVDVYAEAVVFHHNYKTVRPPDSVSAFVERFDQNATVEPFEFYLEIPA